MNIFEHFILPGTSPGIAKIPLDEQQANQITIAGKNAHCKRFKRNIYLIKAKTLFNKIDAKLERLINFSRSKYCRKISNPEKYLIHPRTLNAICSRLLNAKRISMYFIFFYFKEQSSVH